MDTVKILLLIPALVFAQATKPHTYEERFGKDVGSISSPRLSEPSRNSFTYVQNDGAFSIVGGMLFNTVQSTPAESDLYVRATSSVTRTMGMTFLFKYKPSTLGSGAGTTRGTTIGFSDNSVISQTSMRDYAVEFSGSNIGVSPSYGGTARFQSFDTASVDSIYYFAIVFGGYTGSSYITNSPYFPGETPSSYLDGFTVFSKKNNEKNWRLRYKSNNSETATLWPVSVMQYNGAGSLDNFILVDDDLTSIMEPANYISAVGTNGTSLFDYTPQQGTPWDSLSGDFLISSNYFVGSGTVAPAPASFGYMTVKDFGTTDMYCEFVCDSDGSQFPRMVLRYDPADSTGIGITVRGDTDELECYEIDWSNGSATLIANVDIGTLPATDWILRASATGNTIRAWVAGGTAYNSLSVTTTFNNTNTYFGFGANDSTPDFKLARWHYGGKEGQYDILNQLMGISFAQRRGAQ